MKAIKDRYAALAMQAGKDIAQDMAGIIDSSAVQELYRLSGQSEVSANLSQWLASSRQGLERSSWFSLVASGICQSIAMGMDQGWPRVVLFGTATGLAAIAYNLGQQSRAISPLIQVTNTLEAAKTMNSLLKLYEGKIAMRSATPGLSFKAQQRAIANPGSVLVTPVGVTPSQQATTDPRWRNLKFFDWNELRNGDQYPHLAVLGATGGGKTYATERIVAYLCPDASRVKVITTKRKASQWQGWRVIGPVRDFQAIGRELRIEIQDMTDRLARVDDPNLIESWSIFDEVPAIAAELREVWYDTVSALIREARESKKRCFFLIQGNQVKMIGLEGQSDLRENLTYVRLGKFAKLHAKALIQAGQADQLLMDWLDFQQYPMMVEDYPAVLPPDTQKFNLQADLSDGSDTLLEDSEQELDTDRNFSYSVGVPPTANI